MVPGMATTKVTITLPDDELRRIRELVGEGRAGSISGYVAQVVSNALDETAAWAATLTEMLAETGGPLTDAERVWADDVLAGRPVQARPGSAA